MLSNCVAAAGREFFRSHGVKDSTTLFPSLGIEYCDCVRIHHDGIIRFEILESSFAMLMLTAESLKIETTKSYGALVVP